MLDRNWRLNIKAKVKGSSTKIKRHTAEDAIAAIECEFQLIHRLADLGILDNHLFLNSNNAVTAYFISHCRSSPFSVWGLGTYERWVLFFLLRIECKICVLFSLHINICTLCSLSLLTSNKPDCVNKSWGFPGEKKQGSVKQGRKI